MTSITVVPRSRFDLINGELVAEASDLGLRVGNWPNTITLDDGTHAFRQTIERNPDGDVTIVRYASPGGAVRLTIFND